MFHTNMFDHVFRLFLIIGGETLSYYYKMSICFYSIPVLFVLLLLQKLPIVYCRYEFHLFNCSYSRLMPE